MSYFKTPTSKFHEITPKDAINSCRTTADQKESAETEKTGGKDKEKVPGKYRTEFNTTNLQANLKVNHSQIVSQ